MSFEITDNQIIKSGKCWYRDEYGNTAFFHKKSNQFTARLRFMNPNVKALPITVDVLSQNDDIQGVNLNIEYKNNVDKHTDDIASGIQGFAFLVQKWVDMMHDIEFLEADYNLLAKIVAQNRDKPLTKEELAEFKINLLSEYDELKDLVKIAD